MAVNGEPGASSLAGHDEETYAELAKAYREQGFVHVPGVLTPAEVEVFRDASNRLMNAKKDVVRWADWEDDNQTIMRYVVDGWLKDETLAGLALHRGICAIAGRLTGRSLRLMSHEILVKDPGDSVITAPHDDDGGIPVAGSPVSLAAWVALADVPVDRGCLAFIPGSHLRPEAGPEQDPWDAFGTWPDLLWEPQLAVPLRAGDCTFHHRRTVHMAGANKTELPRISNVTRYVDAEATYLPKFGDGQKVELPELQAGQRLDGRRYPVVT